MYKFVWGVQEIWTRKSHTWNEKFILEMYLKESEKNKGTQCLSLLSALAVGGGGGGCFVFSHVPFNSVTFVRKHPWPHSLGGQTSSENYTLKYTRRVRDSNGPGIEAGESLCASPKPETRQGRVMVDKAHVTEGVMPSDTDYDYGFRLGTG